jgi:hypothetical protein
MTNKSKRKYLTIGDIQKKYLPISSKKLRAWIKENLPIKHIGRRIYVERAALETFLSSEDGNSYPLD